MMAAPLRIMFLGNRRIAWEALKLLLSDRYRSRFDIRALVSDASIWNAYQLREPLNSTCFISSDRRQSEKIHETIRKERIDVLISIQYNWIIPGNILDLVNRRAFNLHNARLPDYKGYHSITHAIANQDTSYDTTIHWMADAVDSGDIAYIEKTPIRSDDTAQSLYLRTVDAAMLAVEHLLDDLSSGAALPKRPMSEGAGAFYAQSSVASLADVTGLVNADQLAKIARATYFPPNNTAHFFHAGRKYIIVPASGFEKMAFVGKLVNEPQF
ncbi:WbcV protein [Laribacter hongkongensis HLHK9]|uniref:WbcV protein n=1 Tax=Laribacter hongkongensis (strain HLHK9) TaxID=557598 RepID=C1DDE3_LARHH|nr:formyltransferase family protein [Laribacter hongkongensis]ACO75775.1 WbcV protein [Laribacter hongkongensis HLHK9]